MRIAAEDGIPDFYTQVASVALKVANRSSLNPMNPVASSTINMRTLNPRPGRWYVAMTCPHCQYQLYLFEDFTQGESDFGESTIALTCPNCKRKFVSQIERYLHTDESADGVRAH